MAIKLESIMYNVLIRHTFHQSGGAHTGILWRRYLREFAPLLLAEVGGR